MGTDRFQSWHALIGIAVAGGAAASGGMSDDALRALYGRAGNEIREDERRCLAFLLRAVLVGDVVTTQDQAIRVLVGLGAALERGEVVTVSELKGWAS